MNREETGLLVLHLREPARYLDFFNVVFLHSLQASGVFKYTQKLSFFTVTK